MSALVREVAAAADRFIGRPVRHAGELLAFALDTAWTAVTSRPAWRELVAQHWSVAGSTALPVVSVAAAVGAVAAVQVGALTRPLSPPAAPVLAMLALASPLLTGLVVAVTGGSAVCARIAARAGNDEIEAMELVGGDPLRRLAVPAVLAMGLTSALLNGLVSAAAAGGWYVVRPDAPYAPTASIAGAVEALFYGAVVGLVAAHHGFAGSGDGPAHNGEPPRAARVGAVVARSVGASVLAVLAAAALLALARGALLALDRGSL